VRSADAPMLLIIWAEGNAHFPPAALGCRHPCTAGVENPVVSRHLLIEQEANRTPN
jgi:hypothetical protein